MTGRPVLLDRWTHVMVIGVKISSENDRETNQESTKHNLKMCYWQSGLFSICCICISTSFMVFLAYFVRAINNYKFCNWNKSVVTIVIKCLSFCYMYYTLTPLMTVAESFSLQWANKQMFFKSVLETFEVYFNRHFMN